MSTALATPVTLFAICCAAAVRLAMELLGAATLLFGTSLSAHAYEIWVTNQRTNKIQILDGTSLQVTGEITAGGKPHNITFGKDAKTAYVANLRSNDVTVIDASSRAIVATIPTGRTTHHVAVSPDRELLLVVNRGDETVTAVDAKRLNRLAVIPVGKHPNMVVFTPDGKRAYVSNSGDGSLSVIDIQTSKVAETIEAAGRDVSGMAMTPDGRKLIVIATGENKYRIIDTTTQHTIAEGPTGQDPRSIALMPDGGQVLIANRVSNSLTMVDVRSGQVIGTIADIGDKPSSVAVSSDGKQAFAVLIGMRAAGDPPQRLSGKDAGLAVIDLATGQKSRMVSLGGDPYGVAVRD